jgi:hypothetical protein
MYYIKRNVKQREIQNTEQGTQSKLFKPDPQSLKLFCCIIRHSSSSMKL